MTKFFILILIIILIVVGGFFFIANYTYTQRQGEITIKPDYKNIEYIVEGQTVKLINGYSEMEVVMGSASKIITKYFGNEAYGDLNGDEISDIVFLITQEGGGSGTFYYAVAALNTDLGYHGTNAVFIGDRIAPQTTEIRNGEIIINYADRKPDEPMINQPSVGVSKYLKILEGKLVDENKK